MIFDPPTGQWFVAQDGQRWWFDSGSIAFDFAYTGGFSGPPEWEYWHRPEDVARWWRERFGVAVPVSGADYERARELRPGPLRVVADRGPWGNQNDNSRSNRLSRVVEVEEERAFTNDDEADAVVLARLHPTMGEHGTDEHR
ncbi:MAG: hypothetical protein QM607_12355 [Microbacterium sp.]